VTAAKEHAGKGKRSTKQSRRVHEVTGIARAVARLFDLPCYVLAPSSVKIAVLGRGGGNAKKQRVIDAVRILLRAPKCSSHAADAAAVCVGALSVHRMHQILALTDKASAINRKRKP
jgi:Holliday junction resolvasome RuvABC endonuclease subunit